MIEICRVTSQFARVGRGRDLANLVNKVAYHQNPRVMTHSVFLQQDWTGAKFHANPPETKRIWSPSNPQDVTVTAGVLQLLLLFGIPVLKISRVSQAFGLGS